MLRAQDHRVKEEDDPRGDVLHRGHWDVLQRCPKRSSLPLHSSSLDKMRRTTVTRSKTISTEIAETATEMILSMQMSTTRSLSQERFHTLMLQCTTLQSTTLRSTMPQSIMLPPLMLQFTMPSMISTTTSTCSMMSSQSTTTESAVTC